MDERLDVYRPFCDDRGVDLLVDTPKGYKKVQIKSRSISKPRKGIEGKATSIEIKLTKYINSGIDVIAVYYIPNDWIAYVPYENNHHMTLAIEPASNNQVKHRKFLKITENFQCNVLQQILLLYGIQRSCTNIVENLIGQNYTIYYALIVLITNTICIPLCHLV